MRKKRKSNGNCPVESQSDFSSWSDLPNDLLLNIFHRVDRKYLFWVISLVCRSWQLVCWDILFWHGDLLNLGNLKGLCNTDAVEDKFDKMGLALTRVMTSLFDHHGNMLEDMPKRTCCRMMFPLFQPSDKHLIYVAERTPKIQGIYLNLDSITGKGFSRAIRNWKDFEVLYMGPPSDHHYTHIIQEIGINCGNLKHFGMFSVPGLNCSWFRLDEYNSKVMVENLRNLRTIVLEKCYLNKFGLQTLMSKCLHLMVLDLKRCRRALEEARVTRHRRAVDAQPLRYIQKPLAVRLKKIEDGSGEWLICGRPGTHDIFSVITQLWGGIGNADANVMLQK